jgi:hypothetical protein
MRDARWGVDESGVDKAEIVMEGTRVSNTAPGAVQNWPYDPAEPALTASGSGKTGLCARPDDLHVTAPSSDPKLRFARASQREAFFGYRAKRFTSIAFFN